MLLVEAFIAFILVFTVISTTTDKRVPPGIAAICIGFALSAGVLLGGPVSGGAGNPARALGPNVGDGNFPRLAFLYHWATPRRRCRGARLSVDQPREREESCSRMSQHKKVSS